MARKTITAWLSAFVSIFTGKSLPKLSADYKVAQYVGKDGQKRNGVQFTRPGAGRMTGRVESLYFPVASEEQRKETLAALLHIAKTVHGMQIADIEPTAAKSSAKGNGGKIEALKSQGFTDAQIVKVLASL